MGAECRSRKSGLASGEGQAACQPCFWREPHRIGASGLVRSGISRQAPAAPPDRGRPAATDGQLRLTTSSLRRPRTCGSFPLRRRLFCCCRPSPAHAHARPRSRPPALLPLSPTTPTQATNKIPRNQPPARPAPAPVRCRPPKSALSCPAPASADKPRSLDLDLDSDQQTASCPRPADSARVLVARLYVCDRHHPSTPPCGSKVVVALAPSGTSRRAAPSPPRPLFFGLFASVALQPIVSLPSSPP